jgi:hypothetical protein
MDNPEDAAAVSGLFTAVRSVIIIIGHAVTFLTVVYILVMKGGALPVRAVFIFTAPTWFDR